MKTLKYAIRFLLRSKSYTLINLLGLAFSLACCIILMRYIHRELTVDTHCVDREQVYALIQHIDGGRNLSMKPRDMDMEKLQIETLSEIKQTKQEYLSYNQKVYPTDVLAIDTNFLKLFNYELLQGSIQLDKPGTVILTEECARRIFGKENPIGKVLRTSARKDAIVTGIIRKAPNKSILTFDALLDPSYNKVGSYLTLLHFSPNADIKQIEKQFEQTRYSHYDHHPHPYHYSLINLKELYWNKELSEKAELNTGNKTQLGILATIGLIILLTGVMNFVNLYLICMQKRNKEYGLRKVFGIDGKGLFLHIWLENLLIITSALTLAGLLLEITYVPINRLLDYPFGYTPFDGWLFCAILLLLPILTSLYPYFKLHFAPPIVSLRSIGSERQSVRNRMVFLCIQYVFTFLLTILAFYFNKQLSLLLNTDPGFRTENVMTAYLGKVWSNVTEKEMNNPFFGVSRVNTLKEKLAECPYIEYIEPRLILKSGNWEQTYINDKGEECILNLNPVNPDFFRMFGLKFIEGKLPETSQDEGFYEHTQYVVNQAGLKALGYTSHRDGKIMETARKNSPYAEALPIRAVIEDFYGGNLTEGYKPMLFEVREHTFIPSDGCQIAYSSGRLNDLVNFLRQVNLETFGIADFDYTLLGNDVKALYKNDRIVAIIYTSFSLIAIIVSCLGLFGISLFDIRQRYREIAIRKAHGAGMKDLYQLLFKKYLLVLGASFVVAVPLAYYLIHQYTADFVVKAPIGIGIFVIALLLVALISMGTLWWQIRKAANIDPATVMKSE